MQIQRHELAARLESLLTGFRFVSGCDTRRSDGVVDLWIHCERSEDGRQHHLISVFGGFPGPSLASGLWWTIRRVSEGQIARVGLTNKRGLLHIRDLEPGDYTLEFELLETIVWPPSTVPQRRLRPKSAEVPRQRDEQLTPPSLESPFEPHCFTTQSEANRGLSSGELFRCKSAAGTTCLRSTAAGDMVIQAQFRSDLIADRLAHVRVWDEENRLLAEGYLGLYLINDGQAYLGETRLNVLAPDLREMISRGCPCYFGVAPQVGRRLIARDRQTLEKSLSAAVQPASRKVLEELLGTSPERWREQSTFATDP